MRPHHNANRATSGADRRASIEASVRRLEREIERAGDADTAELREQRDIARDALRRVDQAPQIETR